MISMKTSLHRNLKHGDQTCSSENILKASKARKWKKVGIGTLSSVFSCAPPS